MSERTSYTPGTPCWVELAAPRTSRPAQSFYGELFGWEMPELPNSAELGGYRRAKKGGKDVAGVLAADAGGPADRSGRTYVSVADADGDRWRRSSEAGGQVDRRADGRDGPRHDGASSPTRPAPSSASGSPAPSPAPSWSTSPAPSAGTSSAPATPPPPRSSTAPVFGWGSDDEEIGAGSAPTRSGRSARRWSAACSTSRGSACPTRCRPHWLVYFTVEDTDAAVEKVKGGGGDVQDRPDRHPGRPLRRRRRPVRRRLRGDAAERGDAGGERRSA